jgi:hypothetical protein
MPESNPPPHAVSEVCGGDTVLSQEPLGVIPPYSLKLILLGCFLAPWPMPSHQDKARERLATISFS